MKLARIIAIAIGSTLIASCDRPADQTTPASAPTEVGAGAADASQEPAAAAVPEVPENINPAVVLEVSPNPLELCDGSKLGTVEVRWDVTAAAPSNFSIWVAAPNQERKLWMSSKESTGNNKTGDWVRDQTRFWLVDDKGVVIATTTVATGACADQAPAAPATPAQ
ncbi:MAG: hypothetical protein ABI538_00155 [Pseudoxanthomonas sp.]